MNAAGLQVRAALVGRFEDEVAAGRKRVEAAVKHAMFAAGDDLQLAWRTDIVASGLARAEVLTKTVRLKRYPNSGLDPAVVVYSNFPIIQRAFEQAKTLKARRGKYLLVPNPDVWPTGRASRAKYWAGTGRYSATWATAEHRFGPLRIVPPRAGRAGLVIAEVRHSVATGRFNKIRRSEAALKRGGGTLRGTTTVIVFFLARQTRQPRKLHGAELRRRAGANLQSRLQRDFVRFFDAPDGQLALVGPSA